MHFTLALAIDQSECSACSESYQRLSAEENPDGPRYSREKRAGENIHTQDFCDQDSCSGQKKYMFVSDLSF